jgi:transposase
LKEIIRQLLEKNRHLETENAELRRRLGKDSSNSDKPPSSKGYKKKRVKPDLPKDTKGSQGGQKGHKGNTLKRVDQPDHEQTPLPKECQSCGRQFKQEETPIVQRRQVFDLAEPKLEVTEHRIGPVEYCGLWQRGQYPTEVTATVQ